MMNGGEKNKLKNNFQEGYPRQKFQEFLFPSSAGCQASPEKITK